MILGFDKRFPDKILGGTKKHTIREDTYGRWKAGMKIQLATGVRTKNYAEFAELICKDVQKIEIKYTDNRGIVEIYIDDKFFGSIHRFIPDKSVNQMNVVKLITNDGFDNIKDFLTWFKRDFTGKIIHWTDLRY